MVHRTVVLYSTPAPAEACEDHPGGATGTIRGARWWIGSPDFALGPAAMPEGLAGELALARERVG